MEKAISEIVGQAELKSGRSTEVYRALRSLLCSSCGSLIAESALFTRRRVKAIGLLRIMPQCQRCAPFTLRVDKKEKSALLQSLLREPPGSSKSAGVPAVRRSTEVSAKQEERNIDEEVRRRLGPALKRGRK